MKSTSSSRRRPASARARYLVPAVLWATQNNERVVISTATINCRSKLIAKDLPMLAQALDIDFRAAVVKGRSNYLCPRRLLTLRRRGATSIAELRVLAKILVWLLDSDSGDRGEISLRGYEENAIWARLSAADEGCTLDRCHDQMHGVCPFYKARRAAESAHVLVVNHALLLSDVQIGNRVLPDYRYLIVDEGHHLEEATTSGLSFQTSESAIQRQLDDLGDCGAAGDVIRSTRGSVPGNYFSQVEEYVQTVSNAVQDMRRHTETYFEYLYRFLDNARLLRRTEYMIQVRITPQLREMPGWEQVEAAWNVLSQFTQGISNAMGTLARGLGGLHEFDVVDFDDLLSSVQAAARHLAAIHQQLSAFTEQPDPNMIYWIELQQDREQLSVHAAPLNGSAAGRAHLGAEAFRRADQRDAAHQRHIRIHPRPANAFDVNEAVIGSPFDYKAATLVAPTDMPDPEPARRVPALRRARADRASRRDRPLAGAVYQLRAAPADGAGDPAGAGEHHRLRPERRHQPPDAGGRLQAGGAGRAARHAIVLGRGGHPGRRPGARW